jgi:hypothetical protein
MSRNFEIIPHVIAASPAPSSRLNITPEDKSNSTVRVGIGWVPSQKFAESQLVGFDRVEVDGTVVWSRPKEITIQKAQDEDGFLEHAKRVGLVDENGIPG